MSLAFDNDRRRSKCRSDDSDHCAKNAHHDLIKLLKFALSLDDRHPIRARAVEIVQHSDADKKDEIERPKNDRAISTELGAIVAACRGVVEINSDIRTHPAAHPCHLLHGSRCEFEE